MVPLTASSVVPIALLICSGLSSNPWSAVCAGVRLLAGREPAEDGEGVAAGPARGNCRRRRRPLRPPQRAASSIASVCRWRARRVGSRGLSCLRCRFGVWHRLFCLWVSFRCRQSCVSRTPLWAFWKSASAPTIATATPAAAT